MVPFLSMIVELIARSMKLFFGLATLLRFLFCNRCHIWHIERFIHHKREG